MLSFIEFISKSIKFRDIESIIILLKPTFFYLL